ncbi:MAG: SufB/SufD family protein, partial [Butyricicoccus pullicaecorum]
VDVSERSTTGKLEKGAKLIVRERILTDGKEWAKTVFDVSLDGEDCSADVVSRSVAKGESYQEFVSSIRGNNRCTGHSACDAILAGHGRVNAQPALDATHLDAQLIHEAAIGKIAGEQLLKLETLGLTAEEAEERIIAGFLK